jgi:hypothetical protein
VAPELRRVAGAAASSGAAAVLSSRRSHPRVCPSRERRDVKLSRMFAKRVECLTGSGPA